jgi:UPF0716 family protein affecting phage T7 exclusion
MDGASQRRRVGAAAHHLIGMTCPVRVWSRSGRVCTSPLRGELANVDVQVAGTILMVVGVVGLVLGLILFAPRRQAGPPPG